MARSLKKLTPEFRPQAIELVERTAELGYIMKPFFTRRSVLEQARLWRRSRTTRQIKKAMAMLRRKDAPYLADVLDRAGPQYGRWATNALPGQSWHNWGLALDCFVEIDGKAEWDSGHIGYRKYAQAAKKMGLTAGYYWPSKDAVHVQMPSGKVLDCKSWATIDREFRR